VKTGWKRGYRVLAISAVALLVAGGAVAVAQAAHGGKGKPSRAKIAKRLVRAGVHADVSLIRADGSTDAFAVDRGKVTASSATSLTIARPDGKSVTFSVSSSTVSRRQIKVGRAALVFSRNGAAFRIVAAGPLVPGAGMPGLAGGKSPVVHLSVQITRADGSTASFTLDRGTVTATSTASLTIKRADGQSVTFSLGSSTVVRGDLVVGGRALVLSRNGAVARVLARA
jgi:riboflavin synthase alpha subunit